MWSGEAVQKGATEMDVWKKLPSQASAMPHNNFTYCFSQFGDECQHQKLSAHEALPPLSALVEFEVLSILWDRGLN